MANIEDAMKRIKTLECPTAELTNRVKRILEEYQIDNNGEITVNREHSLDRNRGRGYRAKFSDTNGHNIEILAISGQDDYVTKVIDVYDGSGERD